MAIVVEDGTGLSNADSYQSIVTIEAYFDAYGLDRTKWDALSTDAAKEIKLRQGTRDLDAMFIVRWKGAKKEELQALDWPRAGVADEDGIAVDADSLPTALVQAHAELVHDITDGDDVLPDEDAGGNLLEETIRVEGAVTAQSRWAGTKRQGKRYQRIERMLAGLIKPPGRIVRS